MAGARHHSAGRVADEGLAGEGQPLLCPDPVAQRGEVAVLERRDPQLGLEKAVRPLVLRPRLGHDDQLRTGQRQGAHVLGVVPVVADRDPEAAGPGFVDRSAPIARRVVALLVKAGVLGDVDHPGDAQQRAIGVDHR